MIDIQSHWWFVEDTLQHLRVHYKFFYSWRLYDKIDIKVKFCTFVFISAVIWKGCKWGQKVKNHISCQSKHGLSDSSLKTWKFLPGSSQEQKTCTFLGLKVQNAICDGTTPHLHTKPSLNKCRKVQKSQIFKQNWIILIHSGFIAYLVIANGCLHGGIHVYHV